MGGRRDPVADAVDPPGPGQDGLDRHFRKPTIFERLPRQLGGKSGARQAPQPTPRRQLLLAPLCKYLYPTGVTVGGARSIGSQVYCVGVSWQAASGKGVAELSPLPWS